MNDYSIVETRPVNLAILLTVSILLLCAAGAVGVYYTKSHLLEVELANERGRLAKMTDRSDYMEAKVEAYQHNYVDLILTGYMRVGPKDMRDLVQNAKGLQTARANYPTHFKLGIGGGGEEEKVLQPKKSKRKGKKSQRKASRRQ